MECLDWIGLVLLSGTGVADECCRELQLPGLWVSCCTVRQADGNISEAEATLLPVDGSRVLQGRQSPRDSQAKGSSKGTRFEGIAVQRYSRKDIVLHVSCMSSFDPQF